MKKWISIVLLTAVSCGSPDVAERREPQAAHFSQAIGNGTPFWPLVDPVDTGVVFITSPLRDPKTVEESLTGRALLRCACSPGHAGDACETCAPGYHDDGAGTCEPDTECAPSSCAGRGQCGVTALGTVYCYCEPGNSGWSCESCADGYRRTATGDCELPTSCADSNPCTANGTCHDLPGGTACACGTGYAGDTCGSCAPGFHAAGDGSCLLDDQCYLNTCGGHGFCDSAGGLPQCDCSPRYAGAQCEVCAAGNYRMRDGTCSTPAECRASVSYCSGHGTCELSPATTLGAGTGTVVAGNRWILTAAHLFEYWNWLRLDSTVVQGGYEEGFPQGRPPYDYAPLLRFATSGTGRCVLDGTGRARGPGVMVS
jgi:hypothetical protein